MATLDKSNVINGNVISASDISALYDALTGDVTYDNIDLQGTSSYANTANTANSSTTAVSASNITTAITGGGTHYLTFVNGAGTKAPKIASLLEYTPSNNTLQVTASKAISASYLENPSETTSVISQGNAIKSMYPIAGFAAFNGVGTPTSASVAINQFSPAPIPTALGVDLWVTANADQDPNPGIGVTYSGGNLIFYASDPGYGGNVVFTGYIQT